MTHSAKRKGNNFERELVKMAREHGLEAERAYASNGKALGEEKECDLVVRQFVIRDDGYSEWKNLTIQAKKRKSFGAWLWDGLKNVDVFVVGRNRKEPLAILPYEKLLELLK